MVVVPAPSTSEREETAGVPDVTETAAHDEEMPDERLAGEIVHEIAEYILAASVLFEDGPYGSSIKRVRGDRVRLNDRDAQRLLKCGAVVPLGTELGVLPVTVSCGEGQPLQFDAHAREQFARMIARGEMKPASGPHQFIS